MAVIRIPVVNEPRQNPIRYFDETGQLHELPLLRLRADILIGTDPARSAEDRRPQFPAILDTGAPLSVFPKRVWQRFEPAITRLRVADERPLAGSAGGRRFTYFLGRVSVAVTDLFGRRLRAVPVLAQFREDDIPEGEPRAAVPLGLGDGILEGRALTRWPTVERYDPDISTLESHGQWWWLADP
ncbi:MAG TPA: hypothetical protein VKA46_22810 [Gemmataceae bacterium]|nr:hypothetical protein [Gemmataceae bacterium]